MEGEELCEIDDWTNAEATLADSQSQMPLKSTFHWLSKRNEVNKWAWETSLKATLWINRVNVSMSAITLLKTQCWVCASDTNGC